MMEEETTTAQKNSGRTNQKHLYCWFFLVRNVLKDLETLLSSLLTTNQEAEQIPGWLTFVWNFFFLSGSR